MVDSCTRCKSEASHNHPGFISSEDVKLCGACFTSWRALGEAVRLKFVEELKATEKEFLGIDESSPEITISEDFDTLDIHSEKWAVAPETIPSISSPPLQTSEFEFDQTDTDPGFDQTDSYDTDV